MKILITGSSSGIGFAIAKHLATNHEVIISDLSEMRLAEAKQQLTEDGIKVETFLLDVCNSKHLEQLKAHTEIEVIDVLINNAGMQYVAPLESFPAEKWQQLINIMLVGPAMTTQAVLPKMKAQNFGRIINIGSVHSLVASAYKSAYVAAKHGLLGLAKSIALEIKNQDITINTICPGYVDTPMVRGQIKQQAKVHGVKESEVIDKVMLAAMPKKTFIQPQELAETVAFLISPAAQNITAQAITLDGGWTAH